MCSLQQVLYTLHKLHCTEFETTNIAADRVKFYCSLLVKLGLCDSKLIKLNCIQYKFPQILKLSHMGK